MATRGTVRLRTIFRMLDECAEGHTRRLKQHHYWVSYGGRTFRTLPKGRGRGRLSTEIELGHVMSLVRTLQVDPDCAAKVIRSLRQYVDSLRPR